jgi:hypothetical protein
MLSIVPEAAKEHRQPSGKKQIRDGDECRVSPRESSLITSAAPPSRADALVDQLHHTSDHAQREQAKVNGAYPHWPIRS